MALRFDQTARRLGICSAAAVVLLEIVYLITLSVGLAMLESPEQPITDPMFTILEVLILMMMPAMFGLMIAVHAWSPFVFSFRWPSVAYALDILAWDVFFAFSMLFAAPAFKGHRLAAWIRALMIAAAVLCLAGLSGVAAGDMQLRNIGIIGYVPVFLVVAALLAVLFFQTRPAVD